MLLLSCSIHCAAQAPPAKRAKQADQGSPRLQANSIIAFQGSDDFATTEQAASGEEMQLQVVKVVGQGSNGEAYLVKVLQHSMPAQAEAEHAAAASVAGTGPEHAGVSTVGLCSWGSPSSNTS